MPVVDIAPFLAGAPAGTRAMATCIGPGDPPKYAPVSSSEHRFRKYLGSLNAQAAER